MCLIICFTRCVLLGGHSCENGICQPVVPAPSRKLNCTSKWWLSSWRLRTPNNGCTVYLLAKNPLLWNVLSLNLGLILKCRGSISGKSLPVKCANRFVWYAWQNKLVFNYNLSPILSKHKDNLIVGWQRLWQCNCNLSLYKKEPFCSWRERRPRANRFHCRRLTTHKCH